MQNHDHTATGASADADLILRTRSGDVDAFGELWRRHYPSGMSVARSITSTIDPDDLVQESYARIYQAIIKGGGPNGSFRAYLFTSIRNTAAAWGRSRRETAMDELETVADPNSTDEAADEALDRSLTAQAFRGLPTRWQEVLWYTEIEQMKPAEVAPLLGMRAGAVSQLAFRAREGLREAWIQAHLRNAEPGSPCQWTIEHVGAYSRGNLSARDQKRLEEHIEDCARCMIVVAEAKDVSDRLALVLLPLVLGVAGAAGYTAALQAGGAPVIALAAMPSSIVEGGIVVGGAATSGAASGLAGNGGSAAGGSVAAGSSSAGAVTGIGALVGAGSAALVVAGVVAATTIVPGLLDANPVTSMPSASDAGDSSISSELAPGTEMNDDKFILEIPEENPDTPHSHDVDQTPEVEPRTDDSAPTSDAAPVASAAPTLPVPRPGDGSGGDGDEGTTEPGTEEPGTEVPEEPGTEVPEEPGTEVPEEPGTEVPEEPGTEEPGTEVPEEPGTEEPGTEVPEEPGTEEPVTGPTEPVTIGATSIRLDDEFKTHVTVAVSGLAGASVQALIDGSSDGADQIVLDASGNGSIDLRPNVWQILGNADVTIQYLTGDIAEFPVQTTLAALGLNSSASASAPAEQPREQTVAEPVPAPAPAAPDEAPVAESEPPAAEPSPAPVAVDDTAPAVPEPTTTETLPTLAPAEDPLPTPTPTPTPTEDTTPAE